MASVERVKGRIERLYLARQKSDLTKERVDEYNASISMYSALLISQIGLVEADKFMKNLSQQATEEEG